MKIVITAAGSRGDVQPCVALGLGLKEAGHQVTVASRAPFRELVEGRGLAFQSAAGPEPGRLVAALVEAGSNPFKYAREFRDLLHPHIVQGFHDCLAACRSRHIHAARVHRLHGGRASATSRGRERGRAVDL